MQKTTMCHLLFFQNCSMTDAKIKIKLYKIGFFILNMFNLDKKTFLAYMGFFTC